MSATTLAIAANTAYANGKGVLPVMQPNGVLTVATSINVTPLVGNTLISMDDNYAYLTTTQGAGNQAGAVTNATSNGICYSTATFGGMLMNFGSVNANSTACINYWATPFTTNAYSVVLTPNATVTSVYASTINSTAFTLQSNATVNSSVSFVAIGR